MGLRAAVLAQGAAGVSPASAPATVEFLTPPGVLGPK